MLHILHLNDTEGGYEPWPRIAAAIRTYRRQGRCDLLLHAGDMTLGHTSARPRMRLMKQLQFDAVVPGNHDLDWGINALQGHLGVLRTAALCANVHGAPRGCFQPYRLFWRQGVRIAVAGVSLPEMATLVPARHLGEAMFLEPEPILADLVPRLRQRADLVVLLSHAGYERDCAMARAVPGIDLIVGGHTHRLLTEPVAIGATRVVQAGAFGSHLGVVRVDWSSGAAAVTGLTEPLNPFEPDASALALMPRDQAGDSSPVGHTAVDLRASNPYAETPLGNFTTDAILGHTGADVALMRCSGVRSVLPPGPITMGDVQGFNHCGDDRLALLSLTGAELRLVLEYGARDEYYLLTTAGARVVYDAAQPFGERVAEITVGGQPLDPDRVYTVACSEVLAQGGAGFTPLQGKPFALLEATVTDILAERVRTTSPIRPVCDGRLTIRGRLPAVN